MVSRIETKVEIRVKGIKDDIGVGPTATGLALKTQSAEIEVRKTVRKSNPDVVLG